MDSLDGILAMECLTLATDELVPYVLSWTLDSGSREPAETSVLVIMRRTGGVLLAVPASFLPMDIVEQGNAGSPTSVFGPSVEFEVPAMLADGGIVSQTGGTVLVRIVDCTEGVMPHLREFMEDEEVTFAFDEDSPFAFPSIDALVPLVRTWATATSEQLAAFYSPEEQEDLADPDATPPQRRPPARRVTPSGSGQKAKRVTTAALSTQLEEVLGMLPQMSQQLTLLSTRQQRLEDQLPTLGKSAAVAVAQPLGAALDLPQLPVSALAKTLQPPPRTAARQNLGLLASPGLGKPLELEALEEERAGPEPRSAQISGDALAQAVLAQSQALTSLVAQIAHVQGDPMGELTASSSAGVRGATGRAKLQAELAQQKGLFFRAVLQSMSRRMSPTSSSDASPQELLNRGVSGVRYLERFGGYGRQRELGQLQFQVMTALDYMMAGQMDAAMDTVALLAVTIEQACLDGGRMDLATLLCLQEDAPASIFVNRQMMSTSRTRAFAPLADQRWVTCALAFLKELEVISNKRVELLGQSRSSETSSDPPAAKPKPKAKGNPKRKGGGKGSQAVAEEVES